MSIWKIIEESKYYVRLVARDTVLTLSDLDYLEDHGLVYIQEWCHSETVFAKTQKWSTIFIRCKKTDSFEQFRDLFPFEFPQAKGDGMLGA